MILSIILAIFTLFIPLQFKRLGTNMLTEENKRGYAYLVLAKLLFWTGIVMIATVWTGRITDIVLWSCLPVIVGFRIWTLTRRINVFKTLSLRLSVLPKHKETKETKQSA
jgi:hypothetical protein